MDDQSNASTPVLEKSAVERAIEFGIDVTLLIENLRLTPTERVIRAQQALNSVISFQAEVKKSRERKSRQ